MRCTSALTCINIRIPLARAATQKSMPIEFLHGRPARRVEMLRQIEVGFDNITAVNEREPRHRCSQLASPKEERMARVTLA